MMLASAPALAGLAIAAGQRQVVETGVTTVTRPLRVDADTVLTETVTVAPGATIEVASGATLTLTGDLRAPAERIFAGEGAIDLSRSRVRAALPEWWGARANDASIDCQPAIAASLRAHLAVELGAGDYYLGSTLTIDQPNRRLWGIGRAVDAHGSRLVALHDGGPVILVGSERAPASINEYLRGIDLRRIVLGRSRAAPPPSADDADAATGLMVRHVLDCNFEGLRSQEHAIGYSLRGAVRSFLRDCIAFRSLAPDPEGQDIFIGFDLDGRSPPIATGGNASLHLIDCNASTGGLPRLARSIGCRLTGAMSDTFLTRFETTALGVGLVLDGLDRAAPEGQRRAQHVDVHIVGAVLDQCLEGGIVIDNLSNHALVDVTSPYIALASSGQTALSVTRSGGAIGIEGGQLIGWVAAEAGTDCAGITLTNVSGFACSGTKIAGFARPVEARSASGLDLVMAISDGGVRSAHPAVRLRECGSSYLRPRIGGRDASHVSGVAIERASGALVVETVGIQPAALRNGAAVTLDGEATGAIGGEVRITPNLQP